MDRIRLPLAVLALAVLAACQTTPTAPTAPAAPRASTVAESDTTKVKPVAQTPSGGGSVSTRGGGYLGSGN